MSLSPRILLRVAAPALRPNPHRAISSFNKTPPAPNQGPSSTVEQAHPVGPFYEAIKASASLTFSTSTTIKSSSSSSSSSSPAADKASTTTTTKSAHTEGFQDSQFLRNVRRQDPVVPSPSESPRVQLQDREPPRIVFSSSLAGPRVDGESKMSAHGVLVAGVRVPPKPEEPDNCCMSGCVHCVWDRYREEMDEWAAASKEAERRTGLEAGTDTDKFGEEELYGDLPVEIREFMKMEKRLKEKQERLAAGREGKWG